MTNVLVNYIIVVDWSTLYSFNFEMTAPYMSGVPYK